MEADGKHGKVNSNATEMGAWHTTPYLSITLTLVDILLYSSHIVLWHLRFGYVCIALMVLCVHFGGFCWIVLSPGVSAISYGWWLIRALLLGCGPRSQVKTLLVSVSMLLLSLFAMPYGLVFLLDQYGELFFSSLRMWDRLWMFVLGRSCVVASFLAGALRPLRGRWMIWCLCSSLCDMLLLQ